MWAIHVTTTGHLRDGLFLLSDKSHLCRDPLVIWNGIIVDGHNRYKICKKYLINFSVDKRTFESRDAAIEWIILNQFGRRNLSPGNRAILAMRLEPIFKAKAKERQERGTNQYSLPQISVEPSIDTQKELAKAAGVSHDTIRKVKKIMNGGTPEQIERIKKGDKGNTVNAVFCKSQVFYDFFLCFVIHSVIGVTTFNVSPCPLILRNLPRQLTHSYRGIHLMDRPEPLKNKQSNSTASMISPADFR